MRIAIVGGGLGGLAAALFLRQAGLEATVYEQGPASREVGAGLVVPPNAVRALARLGLAQRLGEFAVRLEAAWEYRRWQDGRVLSVQPMGEEVERLYGAPCYAAHRVDLLALLQDALGPGQLLLDHRCSAVEQGDGHYRDGEVQLAFAHGDGGTDWVSADAVVGADGIHSVVAPTVFAAAAAADPGAALRTAPRFGGLCALRFLVPAAQAPAQALRPVHTLWLGPGRHLVHYPISGGRLVSVVAFVPAGHWRTESWTAEGRVDDVAAEFSGWHADVRRLFASAREVRRWAMYEREPLPRWTSGRLTLLGDAAHAMLPFFAQGAAQAFEDAQVLAQCLRGADAASVPAALVRYEALRRPRASEVQLMSHSGERRNHLPDGAEQRRRDADLARGEAHGPIAWLYGHDAAAGAAPGRRSPTVPAGTAPGPRPARSGTH